MTLQTDGIRTEDKFDPWRAVCPAGHTTWNKSGDGYRCECCQEHFDVLHDAAETGRPEQPTRR